MADPLMEPEPDTYTTCSPPRETTHVSYNVSYDIEVGQAAAGSGLGTADRAKAVAAVVAAVLMR